MTEVDTTRPPAPAPASLARRVGLWGATLMGLGSIVGTGVFVSIGIAAGAVGPSVLLAIAVAALVATCNGLSSAQLAANHPVSGGTYEYGYRWLHSSLGFTAGWMFLCAKTASAATAALGFAGYLLHALGWEGSAWLVPLALGAVLALTLLALSGMQRSSNSNMVIVTLTLGSLAVFVVVGAPTAWGSGRQYLTPFFAPVEDSLSPLAGFLQACALMFVAYTGYGRIATLAEEVRAPRRTIPLAIIASLGTAMVLYISVGCVAMMSLGASRLSEAGSESVAPLEVVAREFGVPGITWIIAAGAVTAMLGVLLNLILGISRVVLAMGRRRDLPSVLGTVQATTSAPAAAVILVGAAIAGLVLLGDVKVTWSFSAFTVLIYYAITNLAALRLSPDERLYPAMIPRLGLAS